MCSEPLDIGSWWCTKIQQTSEYKEEIPVRQNTRVGTTFASIAMGIRRAQGIREVSQKSLGKVCCTYCVGNLLCFSTALLCYSTQQLYMNALFPPLCPSGADKKLKYFVFHFSSQEICCFQQPRLYMLMQNAPLRSDPGPSPWSGSPPCCLVGLGPPSLPNNGIKKCCSVATPQKLAMGILNSAAGLYWLVLIYFPSPGFKCMCGSTHPSWSWRQAVCIPPADIPPMSALIITISRDAPLPVDFLDT